MSFKAFSRDLEGNSISSIKSKRSQSALEYMMTYGWAILIIVIVAVILYSMGIFNPSSSITFTSSGFSPFTVSSSLCNNLGYKIAVLAGPIPNNANSLTISKVYLTSATGANATTASYTLKNPVTLKSGQSATILIPNVACNAANVHYSISANIQYSYTASTLGLQTVNTTGTVAGTSIAGKPSVLTSYEPVTITNSQSTATPNPFQQMVVFNSTDPGFSSIATGNFGQNVEFFYYNGTVVPSWLEKYTADNATWWLKIAAISAGSSETVYVGFAPTTTNLFNTLNDGEAPELSSTYAEYDDGANVFYSYAGTNTLLAQPYTSLQSDGVFFDLNSLDGKVDTIKLNSLASANISTLFDTQPISPQSDYWHFLIYGSNGGNYFYSGQRTVGNGNNFFNGYGSASLTIDGSFGNPSNYFSKITAFQYSFGNGVSVLSINNGQEKGEATYNTSLFGDGPTSINLILFWNITISYVSVTIPPPNGIMPYVTFGSLS